jgi:tetratricopeptide (TPR) repeat protein
MPRKPFEQKYLPRATTVLKTFDRINCPFSARKYILRETLAIALTCYTGRTMKFGLMFLLLATLAPIARGQQIASTASTSLPRQTVPADYPAEAAVVERMDTVYRYNADGTGVKTDTDVARIQSAAAVNEFSVLSIPYASGTQRIELVYLRVRKPDGAVVETPGSDALDEPAPVAENAPFYSDMRLFQLPVRGLNVGDRVEYEVRTVQAKAEAPNEFWGQESFGRGVVVLERSLELRVPAKIYVQVSSPADVPRVTTEGGERVYRWRGTQLKPSPKTNADGANEIAAGSEETDAVAPIAWTTFHSWAEVGEWYRGLALDRTVVTPAVKARADELTAGAPTERAKMEALYDFVSSRVRYVGVSFGIGRYQPHAAAQVLANQYGDCKDKHTLLATMLKAEGVHVSAVLIGAGIPFDKNVPMPADFNHLITLTQIDGRQVWLDSTAEVAPFGMLDASLRGKLALVVPAMGTPELERTPAEPPFAQMNRFEADGTLSASGTMTAQVDVSMRGDGEMTMRSLLRSVTPGQWDRVSELYANTLGFGGQTTNTIADAPEKTAAPLHMHYTYTRAPYGDWENFRILPLIGAVNLPLTDAKQAPATEIDFGGRRTDTAISRITLPEGYRADLPAAVHLRTDFASFDKTYRLETEPAGTVLVTERTLVLNVDRLPVSRWNDYRRFVDVAVAGGEPWIQLTSTMATVGKHPPMPGENNPVAAELVRQAGEAFETRDWNTAQTKLDEAKSVNARQPFLWSELGYVAQANGKTDEAVEDYRRELAGHPDEDNVSHLLASTLRMQDKIGDAMTVLRTDLTYDAKDEQGALMLADLESSCAAYGDEEKTLRDALNAIPDSTQVKLTLGATLLHEGKAAEGAAILREMATTSEDPGVLNDTAFALADASEELPLAETAARHSLEILDAATLKSANGAADQTELRRATLLVATWDTMGWVLYEEGKPAAAEPWLRAAWLQSGGRDTGYHYAMALVAEGHRDAALRTLEIADGSEPAAADEQIHERCVEEMAALHKEGAAVTGVDAQRALEEGQSFEIARADASVEGSATFQMRIAPDGIRTVDITGGDGALRPMCDAIKSLKLEKDVPPKSHGVVVRVGVMSCKTGASCELVLTPMDSAAAQ